jgi:hypothetical protein
VKSFRLRKPSGFSIFKMAVRGIRFFNGAYAEKSDASDSGPISVMEIAD